MTLYVPEKCSLGFGAKAPRRSAETQILKGGGRGQGGSMD